MGLTWLQLTHHEELLWSRSEQQPDMEKGDMDTTMPPRR